MERTSSLLLFLWLAVFSCKAEPPRIEHSLNGHAQHALWDLANNVHPDDQAYTRYLTWWASDDQAYLIDGQTAWLPVMGDSWLYDCQVASTWWLHQMSFRTGVYPPEVVPGSESRLWRIDIRNYNWNRFAWQAVGNRDPYCQEPWVSSETAQALRKITGDEQDSKLVKKNVYPVVSMVSAVWFIRETMETNRSPSYYDLLFANRRFVVSKEEVKWREVTKEIYHNGGVYVFPDDSGRKSKPCPPGNYTVTLRYHQKVKGDGKVQFVDFPKNEADWNEAFGITDVANFLKKQKINLKLGAVAPGSEDEPGNKGSIVARNNRLVEILPTPFNTPAFKTYDVKETAGEKDYVEVAPDLASGKIKSDGGEFLSPLPNGGQAGLIVNDKRERIEIANGEFVHNTLDDRYQDVRTNFHCANCHGRQGGYITTNNLVEDFLKDGLKFEFKDKYGKKNKELEQAFKEFFQGWKYKEESWRVQYNVLIKKTTTSKKYPQGWTGSRLMDVLMAMRDRYDAPVTLEQVTKEMGYPNQPDFVKLALSKSPNVRLQWLIIKEKPIPRLAWEDGKFREAALLMEIAKPGGLNK